MLKDKRTRPSLRERLAKPRNFLARGLSGLFSGGNIDETQLDDIEDQLLQCDVGVTVAGKIMERLRSANRQRGTTPAQLIDILRREMLVILEPCNASFSPDRRPYVLAVVGVNGVGKTTTTAKMAHHLHDQGLGVVLAAADTFRAAAIEQLQE